MGIIASKSVGGVVYIKISEQYPLFSASTKYVAINPDGDVFINIPNSSQWFLLNKNVYSEMQTWGNATNITTTPGYFNFLGSEFSPTATTLNGFTLTTAPNSTSVCLSANTNNIGKYITTSILGTSTPSTGSPDQVPIDVQPAINGSLNNPTTKGSLAWGFGSDCSSDQTNGAATQYGQRVQNIDGNAKDFVRTVYGAFSDGLTVYGPLIFKNYKLTTFLLDKPVILEYQNFETGSLGNWTTANQNQINKWIIGTGTSANGSYSAYISSGGTLTGSNIYNATATSVSHLYADVKFPLGNWLPSASTHVISFLYRVSGSSADYGSMYLCPTTITPSGGTQIDQFYRLGLTTGMTPSYITQNGLSVTNGVFRGSNGYFGAKVVFSGLATTYSSATTTSFNETWESGNFSGVTGGWTVANGAQTNKWNVGSGTSSGGTYSLYITSAATGTSAVNLYNNGSASVVHIYRTISIPSSAITASLTFNWRCVGENGAAATSYDYGTVVIADTGTTPTAGSEVSTTKATAGGNGRIGGDATYGKFNSNYVAGGNWNTETIDITSYIGLTKRLIFTWKNDGSLGTNPPMALDNIVLTYTSRILDDYTKDSDGYVTNRIVFTWQNDNTTAVNPPIAIDNIAVYSYVNVPNDKK